MKIKEVEERVGITSQNIRFYEKEGLIHPTRNETNNYREYTEADIWLLERIKILRMLGLSISDIKSINEGSLQLKEAMDHRITELKQQEQEVKGMIDVCRQISDRQITLNELDEKVFKCERNIADQRLRAIFEEDITKKMLTRKQTNFTIMIMLAYGYLLNAVESYIFGNYLLNFEGKGLSRMFGQMFYGYSFTKDVEQSAGYVTECLLLLVFVAGYIGIYMSTNIKVQLLLYHIITITLTPLFSLFFDAWLFPLTSYITGIIRGDNVSIDAVNMVFDHHVYAMFWIMLALFSVILYLLYLLNEEIAAKARYMILAAVICTGIFTAIHYVWIGEVLLPGIVFLVLTIYLATCWAHVNAKGGENSMYYAIVLGNRIMNF